MRVLVVEDDAWIRQRVVNLFPGAIGASCVRDALAAPPVDAAVVDLGLPDGNGTEVIAALRRRGIPSIAFTVFDDAATVLAALRAGARGYLVKTCAPDRILPALQDALAGGMALSPSVASLIVDTLLPREEIGLTARETQLLALLARGATYQECATELQIAIGTVQGYVKQLYGKLEVSSKAEAAVVAARRGLV